jgi:hypothetical protein
MARATIIEDLGSGQYRIERKWSGRDQIQEKIDAYNEEITKLQATYDSMPQTTTDELFQKNIVKLQIASLQSKVTYLTNNFPVDKIVTAWCADYTENLSGDVGTIDIAGEYTADVNIRPGMISSNAYSGSRDGELYPAIALGPWTSLLNQMIYPGWQKFKPLHRYAIIIEGTIDRDANTCAVAVQPTFSLMNYNVNKAATGGGEAPAAGSGVQSTRIKNYNVNLGNTLGTDEIELIRSGVLEAGYSSEFFIQNAAMSHPGFVDFIDRNPTHPISQVTELAPPIYMTDEMYIQVDRICRAFDFWYRYESDQSGYEIGDFWNVMYDLGDPWYAIPRALGESQDTFTLGSISLNFEPTALGAVIDPKYDDFQVAYPLQKRRGDCEDFVLTKMQAIIEAGIIPAENLQVLLCYVVNAGYHAVLGIQTQNKGFLISDQRDYGQLWEIEQLSRTHYWESFSVATAAGSDVTWAKAQVILKDVPIEYMECNASAFIDGDEVIVEFTDQSWDNPKIIGFKENPTECLAKDVFVMGGRRGLWNYSYGISTDTWTQLSALPHPVERTALCSVAHLEYGYLFGGWRNTGIGDLVEVINDTTRYNIYAKVFSAVQDFPAPARSFATSFATDTDAYLVGGTQALAGDWGEGGTRLYDIYGDVEKLNFLTLTWTSTTGILPKYELASFNIGGYGHVIGGRLNELISYFNGVVVTDVHQRFDHISEIWEHKKELTASRSTMAAFSSGNYGFVVNGYFTNIDLQTRINTNSCQRYRGDTDSWSEVTPFPWNEPMWSSADLSSGNGYVSQYKSYYSPAIPLTEYNIDQDSWRSLQDEFMLNEQSTVWGNPN